MEFRRLRYLVKVADAGGFRRASEMLNVAQPALTRQVQALEAEFGVPLLFRSAAGVTPTPQGEIVLREAVRYSRGRTLCAVWCPSTALRLRGRSDWVCRRPWRI